MTIQVILWTLLMFFLLVGFHEWGHYYFAKRAGILVREFAIGFGPKVFSFQRGETRFTFRLLPIGGFARMAGEDPEMVQVQNGQTVAVQLENGKVSRIFLDRLDQRQDVIRGSVEEFDYEHRLKLMLDVEGEVETYSLDPKAMIIARGTETQIAPWDRQFGSKSVGQRSMAIFAGPLMNFVLAFILFFIAVYMIGIPTGEPDHVRIEQVLSDSPAMEYGFKKGDIVDSVNGVTIGPDLTKLRSLIQENAGQTMNWTMIRDGKPIDLTLVPKVQDGVGYAGISMSTPVPTRAPNIGEAFTETFSTMKSATINIFQGIKKLVTLDFVLDDLGGPVRVTQETGHALELGFEVFISWAAILSLYLGIFNLLPFPALDGSRLLFLGIEAVRGKPVEPSKESLVHFIGFALLMVLMIAVTYNDILRLFRG